MARRSGLSDDDKALWARVAGTVAPLSPARKQPVPEPPPLKPKPPPRTVSSPPILPAPAEFNIGGFSLRTAGLGRFDAAPSPQDQLRAQPVRMDHKTHKQMSKGKLRPDARIDLHGMTLAVAQPALISFIRGARDRGHRLVLVITGKGKPGGPDAPLPVRPGALRHNVPHWLHMPPISGMVLQVTPAHRRHGGDGAYYVYLRK